MANFKKYRVVTLEDKDTSGGITYVGTARIPAGMTLTAAMALPLWSIVKYVEVTGDTTITSQYYPLDSEALYSSDMIFIWDDRASLTWDA